MGELPPQMRWESQSKPRDDLRLTTTGIAFIIYNSVLVRLADRDDPQHATVTLALKALETAGQELILIPQAVREFWVVATRPQENNGLGRTPKEAEEIVAGFERFFAVKPDTAAVYDNWRALVSKHGVSGKAAHDAAYVAAMQAHAVENVLTLDAGDFARYRGIVSVSTPERVVREHGERLARERPENESHRGSDEDSERTP